MEREGHVVRSFEEARAREIEQYRAMSPDERREFARELRRRVFGNDPPDVRAVDRGA